MFEEDFCTNFIQANYVLKTDSVYIKTYEDCLTKQNLLVMAIGEVAYLYSFIWKTAILFSGNFW